MHPLIWTLRVATIVVFGLAAKAYAEPPPLPPNEMDQFAFLIGTWECRGVWRQADGVKREFDVEWQGKSLLDGNAQVEEYRSIWPSGETFVYGLNYRMYDAANNKWIVKWYDALNGASFDLGQPTIAADADGGDMIVFTPGDDVDRHRAIFKNISDDRFTWQGDFSSDSGATWDVAAMVIDCSRTEQ